MANTRAIRRRIKSVKNTSQITKAMQMVAASRMRKAQNQAVAGRPYTMLLHTIGLHLGDSVGLADYTHPLLEKRPRRKVGVIVITTDRGLCGALNSNLLREVNAAHDDSKLYLTVGRKGRQFLARMKRDLVADFEIHDNFTFRESKRISQFVIDKYLAGEIDACQVYYSSFVNTIRQEPLMIELLPIGMQHLDFDKAEKAVLRDYIFEPGARQLLDRVLPYLVHMELYYALLSAKASEHSARMVAMKNATDNAKQLIKDLTLEYNKERQAAITRELLEITTAQMALQ